jgi:hypothetical protein
MNARESFVMEPLMALVAALEESLRQLEAFIRAERDPVITTIASERRRAVASLRAALKWHALDCPASGGGGGEARTPSRHDLWQAERRIGTCYAVAMVRAKPESPEARLLTEQRAQSLRLATMLATDPRREAPPAMMRNGLLP